MTSFIIPNTAEIHTFHDSTEVIIGEECGLPTIDFRPMLNGKHTGYDIQCRPMCRYDLDAGREAYSFALTNRITRRRLSQKRMKALIDAYTSKVEVK